MFVVIIAAATAAVVSIVCCKISAIRNFDAIDKYVVDMIELAKESIKDAYLNKK
jgi:hypothetical protein